MPPDDPLDLTVDHRDRLPQVVVDAWLPSEEESILFLFQQFNQYPPHPSHYILPSNLQPLLHQDEIQGFDYQSLLRTSPVLPPVLKAYQDAIKESKHPILSITLKPHGSDPIQVPVWIFDYWVEIGRAVDARKQWKVALTWVCKHSVSPMAKELSQCLLLGLSSLSWSVTAAYACDITPLLSDSPVESYLSSFHIDHMVAQTRAQYEKENGPDITNRHIFTVVDHFNAIIRFYGKVHAKKEGYLWDKLMEIENRIIMGEVDSLGGVMHLPLHWVSVVINFQQQQILYGDSLGRRIPKREHQAIEHWILHLISRSSKLPTSDKITLGQLPTECQDDSTSCGLFALNAIAHHYLNHPLLPPNPTTLVCQRMEITLNIINSMTVCLFQIVSDGVAHCILQTLMGDPQIPSDFSFLSPPIFVQPLPDTPPVSSQQNTLTVFPSCQDSLPMSSTHEEPLSMPLPSIVFHDLPPHIPVDDLAIHSSIHQQSTEDDMDVSITDGLSVPDYTDSSIPDHTNSSAYHPSDYSGSDSAYLHQPSNVPTEVSSAVTSDSDLPPPSFGSFKKTKQTGLLNFFSAIPADEAHAVWSKRKRDNQGRDEEERTEAKHQEEEWRETKRQKQRDNNRLSQQKHRKKIKNQEKKAGIQDESGKNLPVSENVCLEDNQLINFKVTTITSRSEVAAASRPKRGIIAEMKQQEKKKAGKKHTPSKRDAAPHKSINWKSPTFWPIIDMVARQQIGKPNHSEIIKELQKLDDRFQYLRYQRIGEWRDKSVTDHIQWSEETIATVKKGFLPGGHQTHYNVFVSIDG